MPGPLKTPFPAGEKGRAPVWWVWFFYFTLSCAIVGLCYAAEYRGADRQVEEFDQVWRRSEEIKQRVEAHVETALLQMNPSRESAVLIAGKAVFIKYCAQCHRADGGGLIGPNLCDDYWIYGSNFSDNLKIIYNGVPGKPMLAWKEILKPNEILEVSSYIYTLRGTHPPNPKPPENLAQPAKPNPYE